MLSCFVYKHFFFNELSHGKITNGEIPSPFMTFNIAKNHYKSGKTLLSRGLIPLNEEFDK